MQVSLITIESFTYIHIYIYIRVYTCITCMHSTTLLFFCGERTGPCTSYTHIHTHKGMHTCYYTCVYTKTKWVDYCFAE